MNMDIILLSGNLTANAEMKYLQSGCAVINCRLAVNRPRKKDGAWIDYANFYDLQIMGKSAENLHKYLTKGRKISVNGELRQDRFIGKDGQPHQNIYVRVNELELGQLPKAMSGAPSTGQQTQAHQVNQVTGAPQATGPAQADEDIPPTRWNFDDINLMEDDIPF